MQAPVGVQSRAEFGLESGHLRAGNGRDVTLVSQSVAGSWAVDSDSGAAGPSKTIGSTSNDVTAKERRAIWVFMQLSFWFSFPPRTQLALLRKRESAVAVPAGAGDNFPAQPGSFRFERLNMNKADETNHATGGFQRITGAQPAVKLRLAGLGLTATIAAILILWVSHTTWERVDRLQSQFAELKADSFYLGVRMRSDIQRMNDTLLRYRLRGERADYDLYYAYANDLTSWLNGRSNSAASQPERDFFNDMVTAYGKHLQESTNALEASLSWFQTKAGAFPASYEKVQAQSEHLLTLCDTFVAEQRTAFDQFLAESNATLTTFKHLLRLSAVLMLILAAALVLMVYRGMIAPLRHQLTESQAIIARQEKLASLGVLAAGVAHEIRNPLTAIKFRLFSLKKALPVAEADNEDAAMISNEISRLERIVQDFLRFARPSDPELVTIPAQRVLQEVCDLLKPQLEKSGIELKVTEGATAWLRADSAQIKQVLINLVQNAAESIGRDGVITLSARFEGRRDSQVALQVTDDGKGIPRDVQARLFDPFFTTKEGGTGLGLPIAARIVEKHGGELRYQTEVNRGTTFSVVLPRFSENET